MPYRKQIDLRALVEEHGKKCTACGLKKTAAEFGAHKSRADGRQSYCKVCYRVRYRNARHKYDMSEKGQARKAAFLLAHPEAAAEYSRRLRGKEFDAKLRAAMEFDDKMYSVSKPIMRSSMGEI